MISPFFSRPDYFMEKTELEIDRRIALDDSDVVVELDSTVEVKQNVES